MERAELQKRLGIMIKLGVLIRRGLLHPLTYNLNLDILRTAESNVRSAGNCHDF